MLQPSALRFLHISLAIVFPSLSLSTSILPKEQAPQNVISECINLQLYSTAKSRQDASFQCQLDGATLPVITTASVSPLLSFPKIKLLFQQDQYILNFARQVGSVWLGLQCASDSNCRFDDYTPFTTGSYNNFVGGIGVF